MSEQCDTPEQPCMDDDVDELAGAVATLTRVVAELVHHAPAFVQQAVLAALDGVVPDDQEAEP